MSWVVPAAMAVAGIASSIWGQSRQEKANRKFAEYQNLVNSQMLQKQLDYNTPKEQMKRFQEAGLNPNLIYGQGNPGNQTAPQTSADFKPADYQNMSQTISQLGPLINQSRLTESQVAATNANTRRTSVLTELNRLQARVLERNPSLDPEAYNAIISSIKSAAEIKANEASMSTMTTGWATGQSQFRFEKDGKPVRLEGPAGVIKLETELRMLEQRFHLGEADQKIKAEVLQSKEFQNTLQEIQVRWMKDGDITPQHILQFLQLLLLKLM